MHTTGSGAEALGLLATGDVESVVLDLGLPDVDGPELRDGLREPDTQRWPPRTTRRYGSAASWPTLADLSGWICQLVRVELVA